jgi:hypothetical protein
MWIGTDMAGFCYDLIWVVLWIGTDVTECCYHLILFVMCIWRKVTRRVSSSGIWRRVVISQKTLLFKTTAVRTSNPTWDRKFSRQIWSTMLIRTDDRWCCHELIWGALWIGADLEECSHDLFWSALWIVNDQAGNIQVQFEVICGFEQMLEDYVMT